jgi:hypothetical protein
VKTIAAPERYVFAVLVVTQRWAPPALVFVGLITWVWLTPPVDIDTVHISLVVLFALAAWLGHTTGDSEEPALELISTSSQGSATRILIAKWLVAAVLAVAFPLVLLVAICTYDRLLATAVPRFTTQQAVVAGLALLAAAAVGAALGVLVAHVFPGRLGWAACILIIVSLAQAAPWMAPVPQLAATLPASGEPLPPTLLPTYGLVAIITATLLTGARLLGRLVK